MPRVVRLLIGIIVVEGALGWLWWHLLQPDATGRTHFLNADGPAEVSRIMGGAMGAVLGFALFLFFIASAADRRRKAKRPG
jgi:hypothetical protein